MTIKHTNQKINAGGVLSLSKVSSFVIPLTYAHKTCTKTCLTCFLAHFFLDTFSALNRTQLYSMHICARTCTNLD